MHFPRSSGILLHPTSLPGPYGSGDFGAAAYHFVDWLALSGQTLWQILPLGGLGPGNSPYMSSSAFAGNPLLIDLDEVAARGWLLAGDLKPSEAFETHRVAYGEVTRFRMEKLRMAANRFFAGPESYFEEYLAFCDAEKDWLDDYAFFMALADKFSWQCWYAWPEAIAKRHAAALDEMQKQLLNEISFWKFCQWCFFRQWHRLKNYANLKGVRIIGDIPIFIACQSAEVWANQRLFELGEDLRPAVVAGVPPDYFSATGQRWGNPLYRWDEHEQDGYQWWIMRLRKKFELVDIVRIDHFRGFAGYWEIPAAEQTAINGHWMPGPGERLFNAIQNALGKMPIIAEDLGVITPDVNALLNQFEFPGMRVLQFAFGGNNVNPYLPHNLERNCVVYVGTHDNDTTVGWFESAPQHVREHVRKYLRTEGAEINWDLIHAASLSVADQAIYAMQDVLGLGSEHRMNLPGKSEGYWEWRFSWDQVDSRYADRLREISILHGRNAAVTG